MKTFICDKAFTTKFCKSCAHAFTHSKTRLCESECARNTDSMCVLWVGAKLSIRIKSLFYRIIGFITYNYKQLTKHTKQRRKI